MTPAQSRAAILVSQGFSLRQIAEKMHVKENAVKQQLHKVYREVGVADRYELANRIRCQGETEQK